MSARIGLLAAAQLVVGATAVLAARFDASFSVAHLAGFAAAFALIGLFPMHLELGRHACTVTLVEAVVVAALVTAGPGTTIAAVALGELIALLAVRQRPLKLFFNVSGAFSAASVGALVFALLSAADASISPLLPGILGAAVYGVANHVSTSAVLSLAERRRFLAVVWASAVTSAIATGASATIGAAGAALAALGPAAPLLLVPLVLLTVVSTRRLAAHRDEHLRFERLYLASGRTGRLQSMGDALGTLAGEARQLVTGAAALCVSQDRDGGWIGALVDDQGASPASDELVGAVRALAAQVGNAEVGVPPLEVAARRALPASASVVLASTEVGSAAPVVLAVFREIQADGNGAARAGVLGAFAGHASLTIANARLYEDVEEALRHQLDLNRQKDDFVATVSHELRTPLTAVLGAVGTLRRAGERLSGERRERMLDIAERQGVRLKRLIEDLLLVAAAEHGTPLKVETLDVAALAAELRETIPGAGHLATVVLPPASKLLTDGGKLRQIVFNLVENSTKYAPDAPIELLARVDRGEVVLSVVDHGPGIAPSDRERAFDRFVQLDQSSTRTQGGTGLGLYLCRQLAGALGGTLELTETQGGGCTFTLRLPGSAAAGQPDRVIAVLPPAPHNGHSGPEALTAAGQARGRS